MINSIRGRCGLPKNRCAELVDGLIATIKQTLESKEGVHISGFGEFSVRDQYKGTMGNPPTGEDLTLDARRVVTCMCCLCVEGEVSLEKRLEQQHSARQLSIEH